MLSTRATILELLAKHGPMTNREITDKSGSTFRITSKLTKILADRGVLVKSSRPRGSFGGSGGTLTEIIYAAVPEAAVPPKKPRKKAVSKNGDLYAQTYAGPRVASIFDLGSALNERR